MGLAFQGFYKRAASIDAAPTCFATLHLAGLRRSLASVNLFDQTKLEKQIGRSLDGSVVKVSMN